MKLSDADVKNLKYDYSKFQYELTDFQDVILSSHIQRLYAYLLKANGVSAYTVGMHDWKKEHENDDAHN